MQDKDIIEIVGMPKGTIQDWKKANNYRTIIYELLKSMDKDELEQKVKAIRLLKNIPDLRDAFKPININKEEK